MRRFWIVIALLASPPMIAPAAALQGSDTMSAWRAASDKERSEILDRLPGIKNKPALRRCMDETSSVPGHADLAIAEVEKVCAASGDAGQPV